MDEPDYTRVVGFSSQRQALGAAQTLIVGGIGSTIDVDPGADPGADPDAGERFWVLVVPGDRARAGELLGLVDDVAAADLDRVRAGVPSMRYLVAAALFAFVAIPLLAFFVTFKLSGG